jgi:phosphoesterase RecJ-like protein
MQKLLAYRPKVLIVVHKNPDGDAMGSGLGWHHILGRAGLDSQVMVPDASPAFLNWLPGSDQVVVYERDAEKARSIIDSCDLICCLDFNAPDRMGDLADPILKSGKPMVVIDHHKAPAAFADAYYVDEKASSTSELIYRLTKSLNWRQHIDHISAICLYTGIVTDTGSFRFSSVSPKLMRVASRLLETGMDHTEVYRQIFDSNSLDRLRLQGFALSEKLVKIQGVGVAYISLTLPELQRFSFQKGDTEGLVNYALSLKGVELAAFFSEAKDYIKISLRSKGDVDVNQMARKFFSGGGHMNAAGGRSDLSMQETIAKFEKVARAEMAESTVSK